MERSSERRGVVLRDPRDEVEERTLDDLVAAATSFDEAEDLSAVALELGTLLRRHLVGVDLQAFHDVERHVAAAVGDGTTVRNLTDLLGRFHAQLLRVLRTGRLLASGVRVLEPARHAEGLALRLDQPALLGEERDQDVGHDSFGADKLERKGECTTSAGFVADHFLVLAVVADEAEQVHPLLVQDEQVLRVTVVVGDRGCTQLPLLCSGVVEGESTDVQVGESLRDSVHDGHLDREGLGASGGVVHNDVPFAKCAPCLPITGVPPPVGQCYYISINMIKSQYTVTDKTVLGK